MAVSEVSVDDVAAATESGNATVIDVRNPDEYAEGHIPGVRLIPLDELGERLAEIPAEGRVHVVCQSGRRSVQGAELLVQHGVDAVSVEGGTNSWRESGRPVDIGSE